MNRGAITTLGCPQCLLCGIDPLPAGNIDRHNSPVGQKMSQRFVAGTQVEDALRTTQTVNQWGASVSIDNLGENVTNIEEGRQSAALYHQLLDLIAERKLDGLRIDLARRSNDKLNELVAKHPDRFAGFAALPMQDPDAAAKELQRCVKDYGFKGALVNGFSQKDKPDNYLYYDAPEYRGFWGEVEKLDVPFYMHPRGNIAKTYAGHPWLTSSPWGFAADTALHSLRLCGSGLFDQYPKLKILLGHLGEGIPFFLWRIDARMTFSPRGYTGKKLLGEYFLQNFGTGIRTRPYSTNLDVNPLTYRELGHVSRILDVHADGEIWVEALWELRANLIRQLLRPTSPASCVPLPLISWNFMPLILPD